MPWKLKRTRQCSKCPWKKSTNPHDIPNEYDVEKHKKLDGTIAAPDPDMAEMVRQVRSPVLHIMACHETHDAHCIGWLLNQLGVGNNIALRMECLSCENLGDVQLDGEQHERFEDTIPR